MPVYGAPDAEKAVFTGRRVKRGLYLQDDGKILNADINGSANIGRKYDARIFPEGMDYGYLYGTVRAMRYDDILAESRRYHRMADSCKTAASA
jgi:putative transposase